ncbi:MAG: hypothetical protein PVI21_02425 [Candidatus Woesebacteria bacterium]|jgi:hypothetical protein
MNEPLATATPKSNKAIAVIIALSIIVLGLAVALVWSLFLKPKDIAVEYVSSEESYSLVAEAPCTDGTENIVPEGYVFYENADLGYKFAYPSEWGDVNVTTTPIASESGNYVQGSFSAKEGVGFGGNAVNYAVGGREGIVTDLPGYLEAAGEFYTVELWNYTDGAATEERHNLYKIDPPYEQKQGCNATALITNVEASELMGTPAYKVYRFNLQPTNEYYGVNIYASEPDATTEDQLDVLAGTFELID